MADQNTGKSKKPAKTEAATGDAVLLDANWRLESIIEATQVGSWEWNVQTGETVFNEVWAEMIGYTLEELAPINSKTWETLAHPDDMKRAGELLRRHFEGELPYFDCESRVRHKDGHWVWVHDRGRVITRTDDGKPLMMFGTQTDITEGKKAEELQKVLFEIILSAIQEASLPSASVEALSERIHSAVNRLMDARNFFLAIYDRKTESYTFPYFADERDSGKMDLSKPIKLGKGFTDYVRRSRQPFLINKALVQDLVDRGEVEIIGSRSESWLGVPLFDGEEVMGVVAVQSYSDPDAYSEENLSILAYVAGHISMVLKKVQAQEALRESEEWFRNMYERSPIGIEIYDSDGDLLRANDGCLEIFGVSDIADLQGFNLFEDPNVTDEAKETLGRGETVRYEAPFDFELVKKHGLYDTTKSGVVFLEVVITPIYPQRGYLVHVQDLTERKQAEEEKLGLERRIQHAQKLESLGVLAGGIAHDFNNILAVIVGNAELALDGLSPHSPARSNIQEIEKASIRAAGLAKQMLAYSGKGRFVLEPIALNEFVDEMAHLLDVSISKSAVLKYNFATNLPTFDGDATQIRQIIMNLITNASEAVGDKSGVIALSTGAMHCDRSYLDGVHPSVVVGPGESLVEGLYVYLEVADTGSGMDAKTLEKIFDPFFSTRFTGRGLGMSATLGIVRGHKGTIKIYSEVGKGTTIKILFPANELPENGTALAGGGDEGVATKWQGKGTVLIVDDEETVCAMGRQMVVRLGFTALTAADGREAVEILRERSDEIVCVLLDLTMPHMDGEEAFRELRRIRPDVNVILCSGYNSQTATQHFTGKGLAGFIQKPYTMAVLREKLAQLLGPGVREHS